MLSISVRSDFSKACDMIRDMSEKQMPFATAAALTEIAKSTKIDLQASIPQVFTAKGRPAPFTMNAMAYKPATKADQRSEVYVKDAQAVYREKEETGGTETPRAGNALVIPIRGNVQLNSSISRSTGISGLPVIG